METNGVILVEHLGLAQETRWAQNLRLLLGATVQIVAYGSGATVFSGTYLTDGYTLTPTALPIQDALRVRQYLRTYQPDWILALTLKDTLVASIASQGLNIPLIGRMYNPLGVNNLFTYLRKFAEHACQTWCDSLTPPVLPATANSLPTVTPPTTRFMLCGCLCLPSLTRLVSELVEFSSLRVLPMYILGQCLPILESSPLQVFCLDTVGNMDDWYKAATIYIEPYGTEFSFSTVEAGLSGLPVVSLRQYPTIPESIQTLSVEKLASTLTDLRRHSARRRRLGRQIQAACAARFNRDQLTNEWRQCIKLAQPVRSDSVLAELLAILDPTRDVPAMQQALARCMYVSATVNAP